MAFRGRDLKRVDEQSSVRAQGRAQKAAREMGVEMVDAYRLSTLLMDLDTEGFIHVLNDDGDIAVADEYENALENAAERGIEILRG